MDDKVEEISYEQSVSESSLETKTINRESSLEGEQLFRRTQSIFEVQSREDSRETPL